MIKTAVVCPELDRHRVGIPGCVAEEHNEQPEHSEWDEKSIAVIDIFLKYLVQLLSRISYTYNPEEIIIDWSLKQIVLDNYDLIDSMYRSKCEPHFIANIKVSDIKYSNLYGALIL